MKKEAKKSKKVRDKEIQINEGKKIEDIFNEIKNEENKEEFISEDSGIN